MKCFTSRQARRRAIGFVTALVITPLVLRAQSAPDPVGAAMEAHDRARSDSAAVVAVIHAFHAALAAGDSARALAMLSPDVIVLESGGMETRAEYRSHHLASDIEFARAVKDVRGPMSVVVRGDAAWAWSTSDSRGQFRGRPVSSTGAELMVLERHADGWRIAAIHWSSRRRG